MAIFKCFFHPKSSKDAKSEIDCIVALKAARHQPRAGRWGDVRTPEGRGRKAGWWREPTR